ncbi:MAG: hypothetical protein PF440_01465 [Thiomicrorhabdus sp.]|jgi:hypothetical protein|nr:hypothetical protein [Thiomicrorhabdus sp.]
MHSLLSSRTRNLTGVRFGSLVAVEPHHKGTNNTLYWLFECDCGNQHVARGNTIKYEANQCIAGVPSCGCVELANKTKHGFRKAKDTHPAYRAYRGMHSRCYNINDPAYKWYGAKGVTVCKEWHNNPEAFILWSLANGWEKGLHIDKDILCKQQGTTKHVYSPSTCQWVTAKVNVGDATNRKNFGKHPNIKLSTDQVTEILNKYHTGAETNQSELARQYGVTSSSISLIIRKGQ